MHSKQFCNNLFVANNFTPEFFPNAFHHFVEIWIAEFFVNTKSIIWHVLGYNSTPFPTSVMATHQQNTFVLIVEFLKNFWVFELKTTVYFFRSEERRVGKECRYCRSRCH